jgi:ADA HAT complex component 1
MQSVFRSIPSLPWNSNPALNKAVAPFVAHADLPVAGNAANGKRKRNIDASPRSSPVSAPKKPKNTATEIGGAVRTAPKQFVRGPEGNGMAKSVVMSAIAPKPVEVVQYCSGSPPVDAHGRTDPSGYASPTYFWQGQYFGPMQHVYTPLVVDDKNAMAREGQRASCPPSASAAPRLVAPGVSTSASPTHTTAFTPSSLANRQGNSVKSEVVATPVVAAPVNKFLSTDTVAGASRGLVPTPSNLAKSPLTAVEQQTPSLHAKDYVSPPKTKAVAKMDVNVDHVRAICEIEINSAILTKHNELRLIDLEIAKCQVALEQIRRCQIIPFPALQGFSTEVATHSGPSLLAPSGLVAPQYPAPWGVTDGPYTQYLAPWLIQSGHFDPRLPESASPIASPYPRDGRATRGSAPDVTPMSSFQSARSSRASIGRGRHSLDAQSSLPQRDPLVIKRNQDNQWVKLYCTECKPERSDFANVQGFLNHCRISHKLDYKSHEAAAIACGRVVQINESMTAPEPISARDATPKTSFPPSAPFDSSLRSGVHPFITGPVKGRENKHMVQQLLPRSYSADDRKSTGLSTPTTPTIQPTFKASTGTPYLSQLMAKSGFAGDFGATVEGAKRKEDLSIYDDSESEVEAHNHKKAKLNKKKGTATPQSGVKIKLKANPKPTPRGPSAISTPSFGPTSTMHPSLQSFQSLDSPRSDASGLPTPSEPMDVEMSLSPHGADSNPGLVSDRDEDDDEMDEDEPSPTDDTRRPGEPEMMVTIEDSDGETGPRDDSQRICAAPGAPTC